MREQGIGREPRGREGAEGRVLTFREARIQLLKAHSAMVKEGGAGTRKLIQILTLLVGVLLELGLLIEAEKYSNLVSCINGG